MTLLFYIILYTVYDIIAFKSDSRVVSLPGRSESGGSVSLVAVSQVGVSPWLQ